MDRRQLLCGAGAALLAPRLAAAQPGGPGPQPNPPPAPNGNARNNQPVGNQPSSRIPARDQRNNPPSDGGQAPPSPADAVTARLTVKALVLAQSYRSNPHATLPNAINDAALISRTFAGLGLDQVMTITQGAPSDVLNYADAFLRGVDETSIALFYVAGHGIEVDGENLLMLDDGQTFLSLQAVVQSLQARAAMTILFLDACRTNPFRPAPTGRISRGLQPNGPPILETISFEDVRAAGTGFQPRLHPFSLSGTGVKIVFATDPANVALDGARSGSRNSPFAASLSRRLRERISLDDAIALTTGDVLAATRGAQAPWSQGSIAHPIYLAQRQRMRALLTAG